MIFEVLGRFLLVFGLVSYPLGSILESVFLWHVSVDRNLPVGSRSEISQSLRHKWNSGCIWDTLKLYAFDGQACRPYSNRMFVLIVI